MSSFLGTYGDFSRELGLCSVIYSSVWRAGVLCWGGFHPLLSKQQRTLG